MNQIVRESEIQSSDSKPAFRTTVALVIVGTGLAFGTSFLLGGIFPGLPRDLRVSLGYLALAAPLAFALRKNVSLFGFHGERLGASAASGLVLALATLLGLGKGSALASGLTTGQITAFFALTTVAFVEEGIFRGVLQTQLITLLGKWRGLFAGVLFFGLWHIPQRLLTGVRGVDLVGSLIPVIALGVVLGLFMLLVRNATGPAILHTAVNWVERL